MGAWEWIGENRSEWFEPKSNEKSVGKSNWDGDTTGTVKRAIEKCEHDREGIGLLGPIASDR